MSDAKARNAAVTLFLNAYFQIALGAVLATASEILMKAGANTVMVNAAVTSGGGAMGWLGVAALASGCTWLGILCYVLSFLCWIHVLRTIPLGIAFAMISVVHVLIPIGCWVFLHEAISPMRWGGIGLVIIGLLLLVGPAAKAEAKLWNGLAITFCVICQLLMVSGQLLLKHAMTSTQATSVSARRIRNFVLAIACLTVWFFLWLGLMRREDLSKLYPFEGLNPAIMALGAWLILKEKLPAKAWIGLLIVCIGIALVAQS